MNSYDQLWQYEKCICDIGHLKPIAESSKKIYNLLFKLKKDDPLEYKKVTFEIHADGEISYSKEKGRHS